MKDRHGALDVQARAFRAERHQRERKLGDVLVALVDVLLEALRDDVHESGWEVSSLQGERLRR